MSDFYFVWEEAEPFFYAGSEVAVMLLHGFTASPSEMRLLGEKLREYGYSVSAPLLPGHGSHPKHLNQTTAERWKEAVRIELEYLLSSYAQVVVVGLSMGGVLTLWANEEGYPLLGTVAINPALEIRNMLSRFSVPLSKTLRYLPKGKSEESRRLERMGRFAYDVVPVRAFREFDRLRREVIARIDEVKGNVLFFQAPRDESVVAAEVENIFHRLPTDSKEFIPLPQSSHVATMGPELDIISSSINQHILTWLKS